MDDQNRLKNLYGLIFSSGFVASEFYVFGVFAIRAERELIGIDLEQPIDNAIYHVGGIYDDPFTKLSKLLAA